VRTTAVWKLLLFPPCCLDGSRKSCLENVPKEGYPGILGSIMVLNLEDLVMNTNSLVKLAR
jgi:hypothetical protein